MENRRNLSPPLNCIRCRTLPRNLRIAADPIDEIVDANDIPAGENSGDARRHRLRIDLRAARLRIHLDPGLLRQFVFGDGA